MDNKRFSTPVLLLIGLLALIGCTPYMKGSMELEREDYEEAIISFQKELSQNLDNWQARQGLGLAYLKTGQNNKAISEFQYLLGQEPAGVTAFGYAPQAFERGLGQKPGDPFGNYYLGLAYLYNGQRSESIATWRSYQNKRDPLIEAEINRQLTVIEIFDSIKLARQALEDEKQVETLPPKPGTVAVIYFKDISRNMLFQYFKKALAEMVITDLSQVKSLQVLERVRVQHLLAELQPEQSTIVEENTARRVGRLLGAENLIVGSIEPGSLRVKATVTSTTTEDVVGTFSVTAEQQEFYVLEKEIVYSILKTLTVFFTPEEKMLFSKYHTKNLQAAIYFGQGLDALDVGQWQEAKVFFIKAVEEDPEFKLAQDYLRRCPDATVASISSLGAMTVDQLAGNVEAAVDMASAEQADVNFDSVLGPGTRGGLPAAAAADTPPSPAPTAGGISVSW